MIEIAICTLGVLFWDWLAGGVVSFREGIAYIAALSALSGLISAATNLASRSRA